MIKQLIFVLVSGCVAFAQGKQISLGKNSPNINHVSGSVTIIYQEVQTPCSVSSVGYASSDFSYAGSSSRDIYSAVPILPPSNLLSTANLLSASGTLVIPGAGLDTSDVIGTTNYASWSGQKITADSVIGLNDALTISSLNTTVSTSMWGGITKTESRFGVAFADGAITDPRMITTAFPAQSLAPTWSNITGAELHLGIASADGAITDPRLIAAGFPIQSLTPVSSNVTGVELHFGVVSADGAITDRRMIATAFPAQSLATTWSGITGTDLHLGIASADGAITDPRMTTAGFPAQSLTPTSSNVTGVELRFGVVSADGAITDPRMNTTAFSIQPLVPTWSGIAGTASSLRMVSVDGTISDPRIITTASLNDSTWMYSGGSGVHSISTGTDMASLSKVLADLSARGDTITSWTITHHPAN